MLQPDKVVLDQKMEDDNCVWSNPLQLFDFYKDYWATRHSQYWLLNKPGLEEQGRSAFAIACETSLVTFYQLNPLATGLAR